MTVTLHSGRETPIRFDPGGARPGETTGNRSNGETTPHRMSPPITSYRSCDLDATTVIGTNSEKILPGDLAYTAH